MRVSSIGEYIKEQREQAKISLRQLAAAAGVSNPYLSQIERGVRRPSAEILQQIAKGLRISAEALYVQAGILEDRAPDSGVRAAVLAAPDLTERQKQVLLEIYDSFRREAAAQTPDEAEDAAVASEAAAIQAAVAGAARAQDAAGGAWKQATGPSGAGLDEEVDDPLAAAEPLGTNAAATPPDSTGLPDGWTRKEERR
jgi:transcriptional regulator with XRE-family HTH domain